METINRSDAPGWRRIIAAAADPPRWVEIALWAALVAVVIGVRVYLIHLVPVHLWSADANSYAASALRWIETGEWQTDPRRGPVYSLLIAACLKLWGSLDAVMLIQHVLGGAAVLLAAVVLRLMSGPRATWPVFFCAYAYAVYAAPLHVEHLIRNETLLLLFATIALAGWYLALRGRSVDPRWLALAGVSAGLLTLTKNVFAPFPLIVVSALLWQSRSQLLTATKQAGVFLAAFALPVVAAELLQRATLPARPSEPQGGLLLYSRVAQFTVLDRGIAPDVKQHIRAEVEAYRELIRSVGHPQHNVALNRTVVPKMRAYYLQLGHSRADLNRLCRDLALEAIRAHATEYATQVLRDLWRLQKIGANVRAPAHRQMRETREAVTEVRSAAGPHVPDTTAILSARENAAHFSRYSSIVSTAWLWVFAPGLLTSISVTAFAWKSRGNLQLWWLALAGVWWFTMVLLSTVATPQLRYLIPVTPIMFWSMSAAVVGGCERLRRAAVAREARRLA
jgi:hypothetical protein